MKRKEKSAKTRKAVVNTLVHVLLTLLAVIWLFPIFWVILTSLRAEPGSYTNTFFPKGYTFANYVKLFTDTGILNFPQMFKNTFIIAIFSCLISSFMVLCVSYCMSRLRFRFRKKFMNLAMILTLFPGFMSMAATYYILKALGLSEGAMASMWRRASSIPSREHWMRRRFWTAPPNGRYLPESRYL